MLTEIQIRHYALIEELTVPLGPGLNLLTGETGAGKSIIVDALTLLLGARASGDDVRRGEERAVVTARFDLTGAPAAADRLRGMGVDVDAELVVTREIQAEGRARAYLNGRPATVAMLREAGEFLVEVHGQHEGLRLLQTPMHLEVLDAFAGGEVPHLRREVEDHVRQRTSLCAEAQALRESERERARRVDTLRHQVAEIEAAALRVGEEEALEARRRTLANAERLRQAAEAAYRALYEGEGGAAIDRLGEAVGVLRDARNVDEALAPFLRFLEETAEGLTETARDLRRYAETLDADPQRLAEVDERLHVVHSLQRKYGATVEEIHRFREEAAAEVAVLDRADERGAQVDKELADIEERLAGLCLRLSERRAEAARRLSAAVERELAGLEMRGTTFTVALTRVPDADGIAAGRGRFAVTARGLDHVQFLIAPNPGEPARPLARIASGGELSRLMLALRTVLIEIEPVATLIFDEVDAGVGARTAVAVGERLQRLAERSQVICITHLATLASLAQVHLQVYKQVVDGRTRIGVHPLAGDDRVAEIARMLGDREGSRVALAHAEELLRTGRERRGARHKTRLRRGRRP